MLYFSQMPNTATNSGGEEESIFAYDCSTRSDDVANPNINVEDPSEVEESIAKLKKEENRNSPAIQTELEHKNTDKGSEEEEAEDSFAENVESRGWVSRESCYGAIQEHLVRLEDRQRRLSNCMTPLSMIMAAEGDDDGKQFVLIFLKNYHTCFQSSGKFIDILNGC